MCFCECKCCIGKWIAYWWRLVNLWREYEEYVEANIIVGKSDCFIDG